MKELIIELKTYLNTCNLSLVHLSDLNTLVKKIENSSAEFSPKTLCQEIVLWAEQLGTESIEKSHLHEILHKNFPEDYFVVIDFFQARDEFFTFLEGLVTDNKPDFIARNLFSDFINTLKKSHSSRVLICCEIILWVDAFKNPDGFDFDEDIRWKDDVLTAIENYAPDVYTKAKIWMWVSGCFAAAINTLKESVDTLNISEFCSALYKILRDDKSGEAAKLSEAIAVIDQDYWENRIQLDENKGPLADVSVLISSLNHVLCTEPLFNNQHKELTKLLDHFAAQHHLQSKLVFDELQRWAERAAEKSTHVPLKEILQNFAFKVSISRVLENCSGYVADKVRENLLTQKSVKEGSLLLSALKVTSSADIALLSAVSMLSNKWLRGKDRGAGKSPIIFWAPPKNKEEVGHALVHRSFFN